MSDSNAGGNSGQGNDYVEVTIVPKPAFDLKFDGLKGHEELGRPFFYELDLTSGQVSGDVTTMLGATCSVKLTRSDEQAGDTERYLHGIVTRVVSEGLTRGTYRYRVEMRPWIWLLRHITDCLIFQNMSAFDIVTKVFRDAGFSDFEDKRQSSAGSVQLDYCVQYRETSFDFVTRLMEQFGFYYFFKHEQSKHTLVLADDPNAHESLPDKIPFQFDQTEYRTVQDHFWEWATDLNLHSGKFTFQDYNFETPSADLTTKTVKAGQHSHGTMEVYEYPGPYDTVANGQKLTDVRMQAIDAERAMYKGASNSRKLRAGWKFKLDQYPDKSLNKEYLIVKSEIAVAISEGLSNTQDQGETLDSYRVTLHAMPGDTHFRLHRHTKRPVIRGPQTAKVIGNSGDEINTDQYGRIKVKFHWDRSETQDPDRTCWIRVAQSWAGAGWGSIYIPRVGQEVVVEFLEGNPDRPLVTGVVYNATQTVPYSLPANKTQSGLKTNSSTGGSGSNEFRFEDKAGSEQVYFHVQKDYEKKVENNEKVTVHNDTATTVESGNRTVTVSTGNDTKTVSSGNHKIDVSAGKSDVSAATSITLTCGSTSIKIEPAAITLTVGGTTTKLEPSGFTVNGPQVSVTASASASINGGGSMSLQAGMISIN